MPSKWCPSKRWKRSSESRCWSDGSPLSMSLDIQQREREDVTVIDLNGRITVGPEATAFREKVNSLIAAGTKNLVLNLKEVDYIDSTGLGALVMVATSMRKSGGTVKLVNLSRRS